MSRRRKLLMRAVRRHGRPKTQSRLLILEHPFEVVFSLGGVPCPGLVNRIRYGRAKVTKTKPLTIGPIVLEMTCIATTNHGSNEEYLAPFTFVPNELSKETT